MPKQNIFTSGWTENNCQEKKTYYRIVGNVKKMALWIASLNYNYFQTMAKIYNFF